MRNNFQKFIWLFLCILAAIPALSPTSAAAEEIKVPVTIALTHPIAGAQFQFRHTDGLEFVSFERSEAVKAAMMTPTVARDGNIHIGFFGRDNAYIPQGGELNVGNLVFSYSGVPGQTLAMTEVKLVEVIDKDTTNSELLTDIYEIEIPLSNGDGLRLGFKEPAIPVWVITAGAVAALLLCAACFVIIRQRRMLARSRQSAYEL
jgi:hypothetical protein